MSEIKITLWVRRNLWKAVVMLITMFSIQCNKPSSPAPPAPGPPAGSANFDILSQSISGINFTATQTLFGMTNSPAIRVQFTDRIDKNSVTSSVIAFNNKTRGMTAVPYSVSYQNGDSVLVVSPTSPLDYLNEFVFSVSSLLKSATGKALSTRVDLDFVTQYDPADKFPRISDDALLDLVQKQTFRYFWDNAHPVSGLARERNSSGETVTSGGSGFGIMSILVADKRQFITHGDALARMQKIVDFLKNKADRFHGAFPHWLNGTTGKVIPFSANDNGADLVETSYLMEGLLCARQYFTAADAGETSLRNDINSLWNAVEWNWFTQGGQNVLYWHWSPDKNWVMNFPIHGWNEALIAYVLAAASPSSPVSKLVYDNGWAQNGAMKNGQSFYNLTLPLGPPQGGPLFFEHYSFTGINPQSLTDAYADYEAQTKAHTLINYNYCKTNPKGYFGYSDQCWGLTASDDDVAGYAVHAPTGDDGVISPTAALSSLPYAPAESMNALRFFYYKLGDKLWRDQGFVDAFNLQDLWFDDSFLAIDQGPEIIMIENYRSGLLWKLFMSCPEVTQGMKSLGFQSPNLN